MAERAHPETIAKMLGKYAICGFRNNRMREYDTGKLESTQNRLIEELYFASLSTEEGHRSRLAVVYIDDLTALQSVEEKARWQLHCFETAKPYSVEQLTKLSPLCVIGEIFLVVTGFFNDMCIVGIGLPPQLYTDGPRYLRINITAPAEMMIEMGDREYLRTLGGNILRVPPSFFPDVACPPRCLAMEHICAHNNRIGGDHSKLGTLLSELMATIAGAGGGGLVLIQSSTDQSGILEHPTYPMSESLNLTALLKSKHEAECAFNSSEGALRADGASERIKLEFFDSRRRLEGASQRLNRAIKLVARMARLDGAVLLSDSLCTQGFGVKVSVPDRWVRPPVLEVQGQDGKERHPYDLSRRGTRHRAAVCFAGQDDRNLALIVSYDGAAAAVFREGSEVIYWPVRLRAHWSVHRSNQF